MRKGTDSNDTLVSGVQTATLTTGLVSTGSFRDVVAYLNVTAVSGTTPTMDIVLQDSPDNVTWYDIPTGAFTQATAISAQRIVATQLGGYVRAVITIGGATPSFTFSLDVAGVI